MAPAGQARLLSASTHPPGRGVALIIRLLIFLTLSFFAVACPALAEPAEQADSANALAEEGLAGKILPSANMELA